MGNWEGREGQDVRRGLRQQVCHLGKGLPELFHHPVQLVDKGYDSQGFRQHILERGMTPVIPPRSNRKQPCDYDAHLYRERHLVECFINKIKHYRRIFSRFEKLDTRYLGFLHFTAALIWLR